MKIKYWTYRWSAFGPKTDPSDFTTDFLPLVPCFRRENQSTSSSSNTVTITAYRPPAQIRCYEEAHDSTGLANAPAGIAARMEEMVPGKSNFAMPSRLLHFCWRGSWASNNYIHDGKLGGIRPSRLG